MLANYSSGFTALSGKPPTASTSAHRPHPHHHPHRTSTAGRRLPGQRRTQPRPHSPLQPILDPSGSGPCILLLLLKKIPYHFAIIEMNLLLADNLVIFVPFARDYDHVTRGGHRKGQADCHTPIGLDQVAIAALESRFDQTRFHFRDDLERVF